MTLATGDMTEPVFPATNGYYWHIAPDAHGEMTLWRGTEPDDDYPVAEADERTTTPAVWALLVRHLDELNGRTGLCNCGHSGCSDVDMRARIDQGRAQFPTGVRR